MSRAMRQSRSRRFGGTTKTWDEVEDADEPFLWGMWIERWTRERSQL